MAVVDNGRHARNLNARNQNWFITKEASVRVKLRYIHLPLHVCLYHPRLAELDANCALDEAHKLALSVTSVIWVSQTVYSMKSI